MNGAPRRLFVAILPPADARDHLGQAVARLEVSQGEGAADRLTAREGWHLTLAFIGGVPADRVPEVTSVITRAASGASAAGMRLRVAGSGTFGTGDRQILWAGLGGDVAGLCRLADVLRDELRAADLPADSRDYRPHLTISRPGTTIDPALIAADARTLDSYAGPLWTVDAIHLVTSEPPPREDTAPAEARPRSRYTVLASAPL